MNVYIFGPYEIDTMGPTNEPIKRLVDAPLKRTFRRFAAVCRCPLRCKLDDDQIRFRGHASILAVGERAAIARRDSGRHCAMADGVSSHRANQRSGVPSEESDVSVTPV